MTVSVRKGTKVKPCASYSEAELPKKGKRRVVSPLPRLSVVSIIIASRHSEPSSQVAVASAAIAYAPLPTCCATASALFSTERPPSEAPWL